MEDLVVPLLVVCLGGLCVLIFLQIISWVMHNNVASRVNALEARSANSITHAEMRGVYERLSSVDARLEAQASSLKAIEQYLMEK